MVDGGVGAAVSGRAGGRLLPSTTAAAEAAAAVLASVATESIHY